MKLTRSGLARNFGALLFGLVIAGYPLSALVGSILDFDSTLVSTPFRVVVVTLAAALWLVSPPIIRLLGRHQWLILFWGIYLMRLLWDYYFGYFPRIDQAIVFFVATVLVPCVALALSAPFFDQKRTSNVLIAIGGSACVLVLFTQQLQLGQHRMVTEITTRLFFEALNPISLGHVAVSTLVVVLCIISARPSKLTLALCAVAGIAAAITLALSGSRGPTLALAACAIIYIFKTRRWVWLTVVAFLVVPQMLDPNTEVGQRFRGIFNVQEDRSSSERLLLQGNAIEQFLNKPLVGSAYVELETFEYPHNLFVETGMALGVPGLVLLIYLLWISSRNATRLLRGDQLLLPLLFVQYLVAAQFSGALWGNSALWACIALLTHSTTASGPARAAKRSPRFV